MSLVVQDLLEENSAAALAGLDTQWEKVMCCALPYCVIRWCGQVVEEVERVRVELAGQLRARQADKRKLLEEQLALLDKERQAVESAVEGGARAGSEVRELRAAAGGLASQLEGMQTGLLEPRQNPGLAWLEMQPEQQGLSRLAELLSGLGRVQTTSTVAHCSKLSCPASTVVVGLQATATLHTADWQGRPGESGGDPVLARLRYTHICVK